MSKQSYFQLQWFTVIIFFLGGAVLGALGLLTWLFNGGSLSAIKKIHLGNSAYQFVNPLLAVDTSQDNFFAISSLQDKIKSLIDQFKQSGQINEGAAYFRDIEPGRWAGVNENLKFSPGKLLKVALMIAYFKDAESDPEVLQQKLAYDTNISSTSSPEKENLQNGQMYTVDELIQDMILSYDEVSANILYDNIDHQSLDAVFTDLGIDFHEDKINDDYLSTKLYALMFRILYNSTYLNPAYSEKALSILTKTDHSMGLASGLPNDITIAHKFRSRSFLKGGDTLIESHDCGIIYFPNHPYELCVMGIGSQAKPLNTMFKNLSQLIYKDMESYYIK